MDNDRFLYFLFYLFNLAENQPLSSKRTSRTKNFAGVFGNARIDRYCRRYLFIFNYGCFIFENQHTRKNQYLHCRLRSTGVLGDMFRDCAANYYEFNKEGEMIAYE